MELHQTQEKLSILHMLDTYSAQISADLCVDFFLEEKLLTSEEISQALAELIDRGLLTLFQKGSQDYLSLSDDGMIVLQFFRDRLSPQRQEHITTAVAKLKSEHPREETLISYDPYTEMMEITFLENGRKVYGCQLLLDEQAYLSHREQLKEIGKKEITQLRRLLFGLGMNR